MLLVARVEEAVRLALVEMQVATTADLLHLRRVAFCGRHWDQRVLGAEEHDRWWGTRLNVVKRRDLAVAILDARMAVAAGPVVEDRVEQQ